MNGEAMEPPPDPMIKQGEQIWAVVRERSPQGRPFVHVRVAHDKGVMEILMDCALAQAVAVMFAEAATGLAIPGGIL